MEGLDMKGTIEMGEDEAKEEYKKYVEAVKTRKEAQYEELKKVYHALSKGHKVIDIFEAMKLGGVNEEHKEPKLAICPADARTVYFNKSNLGSGNFSDIDGWKRGKTEIVLPSGTFPDWETEMWNPPNNWRRIKRVKLKTSVPIIPAHLLPEGKLENYFILWEVKSWDEAIPPAGDPYLLRQISPNLFVVLAEWDVTEVERAVMRGHQGE